MPPKSACIFCPASKKPEILWLARVHPDQFADAIKMEAHAEQRTQEDRTEGSPWWEKRVALFEDGKVKEMPTIMYSTIGLGRKFSWRDFLEEEDPELLKQIQADYDTAYCVSVDVKEERLRRGIGVKTKKERQYNAL